MCTALRGIKFPQSFWLMLFHCFVYIEFLNLFKRILCRAHPISGLVLISHDIDVTVETRISIQRLFTCTIIYLSPLNKNIIWCNVSVQMQGLEKLVGISIQRRWFLLLNTLHDKLLLIFGVKRYFEIWIEIMFHFSVRTKGRRNLT